MPAPIRSWQPNADRPVIEMHPGTRPARTPDFGSSLDDWPHGAIRRRFRQSFPGHPDHVALARHFVTRALAGCPAADDVVLLTSELATNAVQHSASGRGGTFTVAISHAQGRVRVTVTDDGSASLPVMAEADELANSGRGLILVDCLSVRWGYAGGQGLGRRNRGGAREAGAVWFELECQ